MNAKARASWILTGMIAVSVVFQAPHAHAALMSAEELSAQRTTVSVQLVATLREQVKYLQMLVIQRLERRVAALRAEIDARK